MNDCVQVNLRITTNSNQGKSIEDILIDVESISRIILFSFV